MFVCRPLHKRGDDRGASLSIRRVPFPEAFSHFTSQHKRMTPLSFTFFLNYNPTNQQSSGVRPKTGTGFGDTTDLKVFVCFSLLAFRIILVYCFFLLLLFFVILFLLFFLCRTSLPAPGLAVPKVILPRKHVENAAEVILC